MKQFHKQKAQVPGGGCCCHYRSFRLLWTEGLGSLTRLPKDECRLVQGAAPSDPTRRQAGMGPGMPRMASSVLPRQGSIHTQSEQQKKSVL